MRLRVLLIDNDDSFTWNLAQQIRSLGAVCEVRNHRETSLAEIKSWRPDRIVISPGPGHPKDAELANDLLRSSSLSPTPTFAKATVGRPIPTLGVCLGHQCMAHVFGGASFIGLAPEVRHGKTSRIFHGGTSIFKGIASPFLAARYHSLIVKKLPKDFELLCWTTDETRQACRSHLSKTITGERDASRVMPMIMGMKHKTLPLFGVQFHPESFLTEHGEQLMKNFLRNPE